MLEPLVLSVAVGALWDGWHLLVIILLETVFVAIELS
jgi:hypothetical protein